MVEISDEDLQALTEKLTSMQASMDAMATAATERQAALDAQAKRLQALERAGLAVTPTVVDEPTPEPTPEEVQAQKEARIVEEFIKLIKQ